MDLIIVEDEKNMLIQLSPLVILSNQVNVENEKSVLRHTLEFTFTEGKFAEQKGRKRVSNRMLIRRKPYFIQTERTLLYACRTD